MAFGSKGLTMSTVKDWLGYEQARNKQHAGLYEKILKLAALGTNCTVLVGHHIGFEFNGDIDTENEIPSADTLIFDHEIMGRVFGSSAVSIMAELATIPAERRDARLEWHVNARYGYVRPV